MSTLQLGTSLSPPTFSSFQTSSSPLFVGTNLRAPIKFYPALSHDSNHSKNLSFSSKYNEKVRSLKNPRFFRVSCSAEAANGSEVVVKEKSVSVVLLAGGKGKRMGASMPKQYLPLLGQPIALYSFYTFSKMPEVKEIVVVCDPSYQDIFEGAKENILVELKFALPGKERQDSVYSGLEAIDSNSELVCIHDSARPLVLAGDVAKVLKDGSRIGAAVLDYADANPHFLCIAEISHCLLSLLFRKFYQKVYSPLFPGEWSREGLEVTDDVSIVEHLKHPCTLLKDLTPTLRCNIKFLFVKAVEVL
ncbi:hypothetical protein DH2020_026743 [Rehmannia glutinosa]|uniref:2-C-methyl-D-erythritol 4-phosphate cytidylyltransferase n=1 Tax=Rehmannia glutinosa TaxID=99300 RepID=A0ABR0VZY0_REHGL